MVDFDRLRIGPYAYDIVRFLISVSLSRQTPTKQLLHPIILEQFKRGYRAGFALENDDFEDYKLKTKIPKHWQLSTDSYLYGRSGRNA